MKNYNYSIILISSSLLALAVIFYFLPYIYQYEFHFFNFKLSYILSYLFCFIIFTPLTLLTIKHFYKRAIQQNLDKYRYRKTIKILNYLFFTVFILFLALYFRVGISRPIFHTTDYFLIKMNEMIGKKAIKEFRLQLTYRSNSTFKKSINIGSARNPSYIIDPVKYKLFINLYDGKNYYPLKIYCLINNQKISPPKKPIYLSGYYSKLGFSADQNQHLSHHFTDGKNHSISHLNLNTCEFIYQQTLNQ